MVSVADEKGRLVLMGVDATYCVVDEVDTTTSAINDHFLHQAIEDAQTTVKQEPVTPDSDQEDSQHDSLNQTDQRSPNLTPDSVVLQGQLGSFHQQTQSSVLSESVKTESVQEKLETGIADSVLSNSSVLRAVLQRQPVSLREPENLETSSTQRPPSPLAQNVEIIDNATGKAVAGPVLKRKAKGNSQRNASTSGGDASPQAAGAEKGEGGGEEKEGEGKEGEEEATKKKRLREKPYQCGVCLRWFGCKSHVVEHMRTHTGEKPFECPVCHKRFSQKSNIHQHMNTHTQQRPFRCNDCGKDFMYRGSLYKHKRLHTGERPYTCGLCKRRFTHASQLFEHLRTHTNERPFKCGVCGRAFAHSGTMHRHQRGHFNQGRGKTAGKVVVEEGGGKDGAVSDINHNTPSYKSRMQTPETGVDNSKEPSDHSPRGLEQSGSESNSVNALRIMNVTHSASPLSPWFVTDVPGKGEGTSSLSIPGKTTPGQQGSSLEGDQRREALKSSSNSPDQSAIAAPVQNMAGGVEATPIATSAHKPSPKPASKRRKPGKSPGGKTGVNSIPTSSTGSEVTRDNAAPTHLPMDWAQSSAVQTCVGNSVTSSSPAQQSVSVPVSRVVVLSAVPLEQGQGRPSLNAGLQSKTVTLLLTSALDPAGLSVTKALSDIPSTTPTTTTTPSSSSSSSLSSSTKKGSSKRPSPSQPEEGQKKKRTRLETPDLKIFSCDICSRSFCHRRSVKRHKLACHPEWNPNSAEGSTAGNSGEGNAAGNGAKGNAAGNSGEGNAAGNGAKGNAAGNSGEGNAAGNGAKGKAAGNAEEGNAAGNVGQGNRDKGVEVNTIDDQQLEGAANQTTLLKSLLTLTAGSRASCASSPSSAESAAGEDQPVGEASASLQAMAHLCVQGQSPDINHNIVMTLEKGAEGGPASDASQTLAQNCVEKNGRDAAELNQNLPLTDGGGKKGVVTPVRSHSMPRISLKGSHHKRPTTSNHNQNMGQESCLPSDDRISGVQDDGSIGKTVGSVSAEKSSSQLDDPFWPDSCDGVDSVVVKLEPVDDMESY